MTFLSKTQPFNWGEILPLLFTTVSKLFFLAFSLGNSPLASAVFFRGFEPQPPGVAERPVGLRGRWGGFGLRLGWMGNSNMLFTVGKEELTPGPTNSQNSGYFYVFFFVTSPKSSLQFLDG